MLRHVDKAGSILSWSWLKWHQQREKIWNLSVSQFDESNGKDIDWIKTILSQIVVIRSVIDHVSLLAYVANICTILTRSWHNLLILWMVLSFIKDVVLEVVVIITAFLLWRERSVSTPLLVEFIVEKAIWRVVSIYKWYTTLKWYMQLRKLAKIRKFTIIARTSIATIVHVPGRVGHSLDDECLDVASARRSKYLSLLNLEDVSDESSNRVNFDLRASKSLTTLIVNDSRDFSSNDYDPIANDLSVAEKSMRVLNITAEDVMDARARIQERSYWSEQDAIAETMAPVEESKTNVPLEGEVDDASRNGRTAIDEIILTLALRKEGNEEEEIAKYPPVGKEMAGKMVSIDGQRKILIEKKDENMKDLSSTKDDDIEKEKKEDRDDVVSVDRKKGALVEKKEKESARDLRAIKDVTCDETNDRVKSADSRPREKKSEEVRTAAKIVQCPSSENARSAEAKPCASLARWLDARFRIDPVSRVDEQLERVDSRRHPCLIDIMLASMVSQARSTNVRKFYESLRTSSLTCCCPSTNADPGANNGYARTSDVNGRSVERNRGEFIVESLVSRRNERTDGRTLVGSKVTGQQTSRKENRASAEGSPGKRRNAWNSVSLGRTARPSGYEKQPVATDGSSVYRKSARTEIRDASRISSRRADDSSTLRQRLRHVERMPSYKRNSVDLLSVYNSALFDKRRNYAESEEGETIELRALLAYNDLARALKDNRDKTKARGRDYPLSSHESSIEEREAIELRALRAYNALTLLEDKKALEARRRRDSASSNYEQSTRLPEVALEEMRASRTHNIVTPFVDGRETKATAPFRDSPSSCRRSTEQSEASATSCDELVPSYDTRELAVGGTRDSSLRATSSRREGAVKTIPTSSVPDHLPAARSENEAASSTFETRRDDSAGLDANSARQAHLSPNLREITRNIEWSPRPRGIVLTNKNLHGRSPSLTDGRYCESQRDIVDDNVASALHSAFFFKPEIVARIFRRAQTRLGESQSSFRSLRLTDLSVDFVCHVNNEMIVRGRNCPSLDLERATESRNDPDPDPDPNRVANEEARHDLPIIYFEQEEMPGESETAILDGSVITDDGSSREDALSNVENIPVVNVLRADERRRRANDATDDDSTTVQFVSVSDFNVETSEGSARRVSAGQIEERGQPSNAIASDDFPPCLFSTNDVSSDGEGNETIGKIVLSDRRASVDDGTSDDKREGIVNLSSDRSDSVDVASVDSMGRDNARNSRDEKCPSVLDAESKDKVYEGNPSSKSVDGDATLRPSDFARDNKRRFDGSNSEIEKRKFNCVLEHSTKLPFSTSSSSIELHSGRALISRSSDEELQKLTSFSDSRATLKNIDSGKLVSRLRAENDDKTAQRWDVETLKLKTTAQDGGRSAEDEGNDIYEKANEFSTDRFSRVNSSEQPRRDDSYDSMYERDDDSSETPISLEEGSLMEEFSNGTIPPETPSNGSAKNSAHS